MEQFEEVGIVPAGPQALGLDADLEGVILAQEIEGDMAQHGEVLRGVAHPYAALVLAEGDVEHSVQAVLDAPVAAHRVGEGDHVPVQTAQVVMRLARGLARGLPLPLDHPHARQAGPRALWIEAGHHRRVADGPILAGLHPAVPPIDRLLLLVGHVLEPCRLGGGEIGRHGLMLISLIWSGFSGTFAVGCWAVG